MTTSTAAPSHDPVTGEFDAAYRRLAGARLEYEMLRSHGAPASAVADARSMLHRARGEMATIRAGMNATI